MDSSTLVSIVTPVLNRATTIEACLRSVSEQTHPNIEHIVIDGGSTDGTLDVIGSFQGAHTIEVTSGPDTGMYNAINKGMAMAHGDVLCYLNSDDVYLPYSVEAALEGLRRAELVYGDLGVLHVDGRAAFYPQFYRDFDLRFYTWWHTLAQPTVFWRREVWDRLGGFDESYRLIGDCEYWLRAAVSGMEMEHLDEILAIQVEHPGTLRATAPQKLKEEFARMRSQYSEAAGEPGSALVERVRRSSRWRIYQARFIASASKADPARWPRFLRYLKERDIDVRRSGLLWYLLPEIARPTSASLLDAAALRRATVG